MYLPGSIEIKKTKQQKNTKPSKKFIENDDQQRVLLSVFAYIGPLIVVPLVIGTDNKFVKFHIRQGLVLLSVEIIIFILREFLGFVILYKIVHFAILVFAVLGIINVIEERKKNLPLVGELAKYFSVFI